MRSKSEVTTHFQHFKLMIENLLDRKIKIFQSDGGGEFDNFNLRFFLKANDIIFQKSCPETPQQNGVAERKHRHLLELARTMLIAASLSANFWVDAVLTATFIINRIPSPTLHGLSPFEKLFNRKPDMSVFRVFGCACFPKFTASSANKLDPRSVQCIFLGYAPEYKGYRCFDPVASRVYISRNVRFLENIFPNSVLAGPTVSSSSASSPTSLIFSPSRDQPSSIFLSQTLTIHALPAPSDPSPPTPSTPQEQSSPAAFVPDHSPPYDSPSTACQSPPPMPHLRLRLLPRFLKVLPL
ncbi:unnamed protein product [Cuscuta europaea]|uniref:Integrase catalytic domain-containing protein n=1 Tax=Cuscuta europaea TaxID=41803 RepID=A0A9P0ZVT7_CUSEU|nr:unnamed protein product [Cuscuta europaea]